MELIDKSALVAEIEGLKRNTFTNFDEGVNAAAQILLDFLDTLESKEINLENSMVCKVDWYDGFILDYTQEQQDELLEKIGANVGDKIRIILIKE